MFVMNPYTDIGKLVSVEASDLRLAPGTWPNTLTHEGIAYRRHGPVWDVRNGERELAAMLYTCTDPTYDGLTLRVWND